MHGCNRAASMNRPLIQTLPTLSNSVLAPSLCRCPAEGCDCGMGCTCCAERSTKVSAQLAGQ